MSQVAFTPPRHADLATRCAAIARDRRYGHYVRIPDRICRCLNYFQAGGDHRAIRRRLYSFYLFIGVVDDALDSGLLEQGREILRQLARPLPDECAAITISPAELVTEYMMSQIGAAELSAIHSRFVKLFDAVVAERRAASIVAYIDRRMEVGWRTADLSYLFVKPLLPKPNRRLRQFMRQVGAVGCLVDSLIDWKADRRNGLLGFSPSLKDRCRLFVRTIRDGLSILRSHPRMSQLLLEALVDNLRDQHQRCD
jgi:hypothetical protein